jgi:restriction endonuclease S subunit
MNAAGAVPGVNRNHLHKIKVSLPPLPIQQKIAGILSAYDDLIENNLKRIKLLEEMAQITYEEWFGSRPKPSTLLAINPCCALISRLTKGIFLKPETGGVP